MKYKFPSDQLPVFVLNLCLSVYNVLVDLGFKYKEGCLSIIRFGPIVAHTKGFL